MAVFVEAIALAHGFFEVGHTLDLAVVVTTDFKTKAVGAQIDRCEPLARKLAPLGDRLDPTPWMGARPCLPDMLPVLGPAPAHKGLWFNFGHAHHGLTLGPVTGRLLAEMMTGESPSIDPRPYRADRF